MSTFTCTYAELRERAGEFIKAIREASPPLSLDELDAGLNCVQLHYLGMVAEHDHEIVGAAAVLKIVTREYMTAEDGLQLGMGA